MTDTKKVLELPYAELLRSLDAALSQDGAVLYEVEVSPHCDIPDLVEIVFVSCEEHARDLTTPLICTSEQAFVLCDTINLHCPHARVRPDLGMPPEDIADLLEAAQTIRLNVAEAPSTP